VPADSSIACGTAPPFSDWMPVVDYAHRRFICWAQRSLSSKYCWSGISDWRP